MSLSATKTDNHFTADKVALRVDLTADLETVRVLDVFGGHGVVWRAVERVSGKPVERLAMDQRDDLFVPHLHGDNEKLLPSIDLDRFNVIDLDAYGIPVGQIAEVIDRGFKGVVFVTAIQTTMGTMPKRMAVDLGYPGEIYSACPTLISKMGWDVMKAWLALRGVTRITHRSWARKHYFGFTLT